MRIVGIAIAVAAVAVGVYLYHEKRQAESPGSAFEAANATAVSGDARLQFELPDVSGTLRQSSEWEGRPKLVNFWATWCAPCRREIPLLKKTQDEYAGLLRLQVIGIAVDFSEDVAAFAEDAEFNYPVLVGQEDAMAVAEASGVEFIGLPFTMVVAPSGELIKAHIGEIVEEHIDRITGVLGRMAQGELDLDAARAELRDL